MKASCIRHIFLIISLSVSAALSAATFATSSVLATGRWAKVRVDSTGIYRISHHDLAAWGFADPASVSIAGYGSVERANTLDSAPDDLPAIPVWRTGDAIYFYAEGPDRILSAARGDTPVEHQNLYSRSSYYFITDGNGVRSPEISTLPYTESDVITDTHIVTDRRRYHSHNPYGTGALTYSHDLRGNSPVLTEEWKLPEDAGYAEFSYSYIGFPSTISYVKPEISIEGATSTGTSTRGVRGTSASNVIYVASDVHRYPLRDISEGIKVSVSDASDNFDMLCVSDMTLRYEAPDNISSLPVLWDFRSLWPGDAVAFGNLPADATVWDVTEPRRPIALALHAGDDGTTLVTTPGPEGTVRRMALFSAGPDVPSPVYEGPVAPQNLHAIAQADMLILASDAAYQSALRLAAAHREYQGLEVAVVRQAELFNEFSSGAYHPNALRHLVMMLRQRGLRHLLIMGYGQGLPLKAGESIPAANAVTFHTEYVDEDRYDSKNHCSDIYFTLTADRVGNRITDPTVSIDLNVGRAPVRNAAEAEAFTDKCVAYLTDPACAGRTAETLIFAGYGDANQHLVSALRQANTFTATMEGATVHHGHQVLFKSEKTKSEAHRRYIVTTLAGQPRFVNYTGHSMSSLLGMEFTLPVEETISYGSSPIFYMAGCNTSKFDTGELSLGVKMTGERNGPIAVIGTSREVYMANNHLLNNRFVDALCAATPDMTLGDIFTRALNDSHAFTATTSARDQVINNCSYSFFGDPALPSYAPSGTVTLNDVGGTAPGADPIDIPSLRPVTMSGTVTTADRQTADASFDGYVNLTIFGPARNKVTSSPDESDRKDRHYLISIGDDEIYSATAPVKGGRWSLQVIPPLTDSIGVNRISLYAVSTDRRTACGGSSAVRITDMDGKPEYGDTEPPVITLRLDGMEPGQADMTGASPELEITVTDSGTGVLLNRSGIGGVPHVTLDGTTIPGAGHSLRPSADGSYVSARTLGPLTDGAHTVTVTASDIAGNTATAAVRFIVDTAAPEATLTADTAIARDGIEFSLAFPSAIAPQSTLLIRDTAGNTVATLRDVTFPYTWDFTLPDGSSAPDGTYAASVLFNSASRYGSTPEIRFTIVKK